MRLDKKWEERSRLIPLKNDDGGQRGEEEESTDTICVQNNECMCTTASITLLHITHARIGFTIKETKGEEGGGGGGISYAEFLVCVYALFCLCVKCLSSLEVVCHTQ